MREMLRRWFRRPHPTPVPIPQPAQSWAPSVKDMAEMADATQALAKASPKVDVLVRSVLPQRSGYVMVMFSETSCGAHVTFQIASVDQNIPRDRELIRQIMERAAQPADLTDEIAMIRDFR